MDKKTAREELEPIRHGIATYLEQRKTNDLAVMPKGFVFQGLDDLDIFLDIDEPGRLWKDLASVADWEFGIDDGSGRSKKCAFMFLDNGTMRFFDVYVRSIFPKNYTNGWIFDLVEIVDFEGQSFAEPLGLFSVAVGQGNEYDNDGNITKRRVIHSNSKITFYGTFFARFGMEGVKRFIDDYLDTSVFGGVKRFDICCDVAVRKEVIDCFSIRDGSSTIKFNKEMNCYETTYIGSRSAGLLLRVYNKVLDTWKREKNRLYPYLTDFPDWTRLECEVDHSKYQFEEFLDTTDDAGKTVKGWEKLFDISSIEKFYYTFLSTRNTLFSYLGIEKLGVFYRVRREIQDFNAYYLKFGQIPKHYKQQALGYLKKIHSVTGPEGISDLLSYFPIDERTYMFSRVLKDSFENPRNTLHEYKQSCLMIASFASMVKLCYKENYKDSIRSLHKILSICDTKIQKIPFQKDQKESNTSPREGAMKLIETTDPLSSLSAKH